MSDIRGFGIGRVEFKRDWEEDTLKITLDGIPVVTLERYQQDDLVRAINDGHNFEYGGDDSLRRFTMSHARVMHIGAYSIETSATALSALRRLCHHRRNVSWRVLITDVPGARRLMEEGETEIPISFEEERDIPEDVLHEREVEKLKEKITELQGDIPNTPEGDAYRVGRKFYLQYAQPTIIQLKSGKELVLGLNAEEIRDVKEQLESIYLAMKKENDMVCVNLNPMIEGYTIIPFGDDLTMRVPTHAIEWSMKRAGNSRSLILCDTVPASVEKLANCTTGSGHDGFLSTIHVLIDWKVNKIIREHAIRYYFRDICSSQSLMYKSKELTGYDNEDDIPLGFKYWISFSMSYLALKTVYGQRRNHRRQEWRDFCACIEKLPQSHLITGAFKKEYVTGKGGCGK